MKKYLVEAIGTFFLVLTVVLTANNTGIAPMAPLAFGAMMMVMVFAGSHISGGHYNPALTLAVVMRGKMEVNDGVLYMLAQLIGGIIAATMAVYLHGCSGEPAIRLHSNNDPIGSMLAELLGAFALAYVLLNVSTTESNAGNGFYGLAIGFTVVAAAYMFGDISGGIFNPAIAIGAAIAGMFAAGDLWIYVLGAGAGGAVAATVFSVIYGKEA